MSKGSINLDSVNTHERLVGGIRKKVFFRLKQQFRLKGKITVTVSKATYFRSPQNIMGTEQIKNTDK